MWPLDGRNGETSGDISCTGIAGDQLEWAEDRWEKEWREPVPTALSEVWFGKGARTLAGSWMPDHEGYFLLCC